VILNLFSSQGWQSWAIEHPPLIPERMPVLIDDDLRFEDGPAAPRPTTVVNRWLRELPASGAPAASSWESYARVLKAWMEFLAGHGVGLFDSRSQLKHALGKYAEHRATGPTAQPMSEPRPYPDSPLSTTRSPACAERPTAPLPFADSLPALPKSGHAAERTAATPSPEEKMMTSLTCPAEKRNTHRRADSERGPRRGPAESHTNTTAHGECGKKTCVRAPMAGSRRRRG
jgi:hypothetical protein